MRVKTIEALSGFMVLLVSATVEARYVNPREGRFLSSDRPGMVDGPNLYQYARASPTDRIDPHGTKVIRPEMPENVVDRNGNLTPAARLWKAFEWSVLGTTVGYALYLKVEISPEVFRPIATPLPRGTVGLTGFQTKTTRLLGTLPGVREGEWGIAIAFGNIDANNADEQRLFKVFDGEALVHEFSHAADIADGIIGVTEQCERRAFDSMNKYRREHGLDEIPADVIERLIKEGYGL